MSEIMRSVPFENLLDWALEEYDNSGSIFSIPEAKFYRPKTSKKEKIVLGDELPSVIGPAAGPGSQLAQNIAASYLAGARFIELKTVQVMDGEEIQKAVAKPCINAEDEGYNCEWSTELTVPQAFDEYIKAYFLIQVLAKELGIAGEKDFSFNMSVGYTLDGIKSEKIDNYLNSMKDASNTEPFKHCKAYLKENIDRFKNFNLQDLENISPNISNSVTESTLHGCPAHEIEAIASYLMSEKNLNVFIKCNPTLLGYEFARKTLNDLGYDYMAFTDNHFKSDLQYADAVLMFKRLMKLSGELGLKFGIKLTNTFPVDVKRNELPAEEMYMSGRALLPLTISLAYKISEDFGGKLPISYSGGADALNIVKIHKTGISPITVATTILKPGGYERLSQMAALMEDNIGGEFTGIDVKALKTLKLELLMSKSTHKLNREKVNSRKTDSPLPLTDCFKAPCKDGGCPIEQQIPEYIHLVGKKRYDEAFEVIANTNTSPSVLGRICAHHCQSYCTRVDYEKSVKIRNMKYIAARNAQEAYISGLQASELKSGKKAAVIGAGPVGLAAAAYLRRNGMAVKVFEKTDKAYGLVSHVIPDYRISDSDIQLDLELILKLGVEIEYNTEINDLKALRDEFDYVIIATGAWGKTKSPVKSGSEHIRDALKFLNKAKEDKDYAPANRIAVIGAGDVAMDCVRTAKRLPCCDEAMLIYRRTISYMPAEQDEVELVQSEGIPIRELLAPISYDGSILKCEKMKLGEFDSSGRKSVVGTGEYETFKFGMVIAATGASVDGKIFEQNSIKTDAKSRPEVNDAFESSVPNVYIVGDCLKGPSTIVKGMGQAKKAALDILSKEKLPSDFKKYEYPEADETLRAKRGILRQPALDETEADRCLKCDQICEICKEVCPNRANIAVRLDGFDKIQIIHMDGMCNECGNCAIFCPHAGRPYKDKFTVFWTRKDFEDSSNAGFLKTAGGYKIRLEDKSVGYFDENLSGIDEKLKALIKGLEKSYEYLLVPTGKVY